MRIDTIIQGNVFDVLPNIPDESVQCVITSPPYYSLRNYNVDGQIGLEKTPEEYIEKLVIVFREVRRILRKDGTLWLNVGDSYISNPGDRNKVGGIEGKASNLKKLSGSCMSINKHNTGLKPKDLCLIPSRLIKSLQEPFYLGNIKSELDRIWLSAIIEGEGSIYIARQPKGTITGRNGNSQRSQDSFCTGIAISNTQKSLVEKAANICGKNNVQVYKPRDNRRPGYSWRVTGNVAKNILREIYPYLVAKHKEARIAIACPPSGDLAERCWINLKALHKTQFVDFDMPLPQNGDLWQPGWYVRSDIIWAKPNPMPESVTDRPTKSHEYIYLLTKSGKYFYNADAIRESIAESTITRVELAKNRRADAEIKAPVAYKRCDSARVSVDKFEYGADHLVCEPNPNGRNARSVWTIPTQPVAESHFATFPEELVRRCMLAGTPDRCCPKCGAAWIAQIEHRRIKRNEFPIGDPRYRPNQYHGAYENINGKADAGYAENKIIGYSPSCDCPDNDGSGQSIVFDPFMGSGTTALVALRGHRHYLGVELNPDYIKIADKRLLSLKNQEVLL